jgi:nucleoside-diphosphate-sugar epimerase
LGREGRVTIAELVKQVIQISGKMIEVHNLPAQASGLRGQAVDCTKTREVLPDWQPRVSLHEGMVRTYRDIEQRLALGEGHGHHTNAR